MQIHPPLHPLDTQIHPPLQPLHTQILDSSEPAIAQNAEAKMAERWEMADDKRQSLK